MHISFNTYAFSLNTRIQLPLMTTPMTTILVLPQNYLRPSLDSCQLTPSKRHHRCSYGFPFPNVYTYSPSTHTVFSCVRLATLISTSTHALPSHGMLLLVHNYFGDFNHFHPCSIHSWVRPPVSDYFRSFTHLHLCFTKSQGATSCPCLFRVTHPLSYTPMRAPSHTQPRHLSDGV